MSNAITARPNRHTTNPWFTWKRVGGGGGGGGNGGLVVEMVVKLMMVMVEMMMMVYIRVNRRLTK